MSEILVSTALVKKGGSSTETKVTAKQGMDDRTETKVTTNQGMDDRIETKATKNQGMDDRFETKVTTIARNG